MENIPSYLKWAITALAITGTIFNINHKRVCFLIWMVSNASLSAYNFYIWEFPQGTLFFVYLCLVFGVGLKGGKNVK